MTLLLALLAAVCISATAEEPHLEGQELVDYLNKKQSLFKAGIPEMSYEQFKTRLMDLKYLEYEREPVNADSNPGDNPESIPESFDSHKEWPECKSITTIRDQANCGSCWAVAAASTMSDRVCIQSKGAVKAFISDTDLLTCCGYFCGMGCNGGYITKAWQYAKNSGLCTGGAYRQKGVCKPYSFHPCGKHANQTYYGECKGSEMTPLCRNTCQLRYPKKYADDKFYALSSYDVIGEATMQREIMKNGPITAGFRVYEDFMYYRRGIYKHVWGGLAGGHAVKIVGWGVENGTKYWRISNSWNSDWGEDGYFRMIRGTNDCLIEAWAAVGLMKA